MTRPAFVLAALLVVASAAVVAAPVAAAPAASPVVSVYPEPGTHEASPQTTLSFRGIAPAQIGTVRVVGETTGVHDGSWISHSDGRGASFVPRAPFAPSERVVVHTRLQVREAVGGVFAFTVARPGRVLARSGAAPDVAAAPAVFNTTDVHHYVTRPDLMPPIMTVKTSSPSTQPGVIAVTPLAAQQGPLLLDDRGEPIYYGGVSLTDQRVYDASIVNYRGQPYLAWWRGTVASGYGYGRGEYELIDEHYQHFATVRGGNGIFADLHEFQITPQNTALINSFNPVSVDLTPYGGPADGTVLEMVVQEIDIPTGAVLFEWHSLDHIPLSKSVVAVPTDGTAWDYIHGNAIEQDTDGNLLLSGRHTSAIYKIDRVTGTLLWTLGKGGDFSASFPASDWFWNQHDVRRFGPGQISVFDNGCCAGPVPRSYSRGLVLDVDEAHKAVSIDHEVRATPDLLGKAEGSFRRQANGDQLVGWGRDGEITEFDSSNHLLLDLTFPDDVQSYRAIRAEWDGRPTQPPDLVTTSSNGVVTATVSWNGATDVATWVMRTGNDSAHTTEVASVPRLGFESVLSAPVAPVVVVEALDASGAVLGSVTRTFPVAPRNAGYWVAGSSGVVRAFGTAPARGNAPTVASPAVGVAPAAGAGYWVARADGSVAAVSASALGSLAGRRLNAPVVGITVTPDGHGFWLVAADGGVFAFGSARFEGSMGGRHLNGRVVGMAAAPDGRGYWLVAADGGLFAFGTARFLGSMGGRHLNNAVVGMASSADGAGYWLVAADGGIFRFGAAGFFGSEGGTRIPAPVVGMAPSDDGLGYWLVARDGNVFVFGDALFQGSAIGLSPVAAIARA
jgi:hypothetical protein